jgi:multiple sugar transport system permease protein
MSIISTIGRRHWSVRLLIGSIYAALTLGGITMLYPFGLMIAGSTKSGVDQAEQNLIPRFLIDNSALWRKVVEAQVNETFSIAKVTYNTEYASWEKIVEPADGGNAELAHEWETFCTETKLPIYMYEIGEVRTPRSKGVVPRHLREFKQRMYLRFKGDIAKCDSETGSRFEAWNAFYYIPQTMIYRRNYLNSRPLDIEYQKFKSELPIAERHYFSIDKIYRRLFLKGRYTHEISAYNKAHDTNYANWSEIPFARDSSQLTDLGKREQKDWEDFVRKIVSLYWIHVDPESSSYSKYLKAKYHNDIELLNKRYGTAYSSWGNITMPSEPPPGGALGDWADFIEGWKDPLDGAVYTPPIETLSIYSVDNLFRDWLQKKYGTVDAFKNATHASYSISAWKDVTLPQEDLKYLTFLKEISKHRREFATRNFTSVFTAVIKNGRAVFNTVVYCLLAILAALTVNPLAAYALSRYKPPSQYKILTLLMLTMAFPPMVGMIPMFLMIRDLHLLNTFPALVLPTLANGYSIFLLKGFFDSLPQELYESAELDGAGEVRIFLQITMSLSKPILAVIALNTFRAAYGNFMMALLICQDDKMWTLMPWLFQLQQRSGQGIVFASLLIAAIPTFLVFALCQNVIMRGIVVPVEK